MVNSAQALRLIWPEAISPTIIQARVLRWRTSSHGASGPSC